MAPHSLEAKSQIPYLASESFLPSSVHSFVQQVDTVNKPSKIPALRNFQSSEEDIQSVKIQISRCTITIARKAGKEMERMCW